MNWYKDFQKTAKRPGNTYRDNKGSVTLYHISPDRHTALMPRSTFWGVSGLFLSESYRSIMQDWWYYVSDKKAQKHPLIQEMKGLRRKINEMEESDPQNPEINRLEDEHTEIAKRVNDEEFERANPGYKVLFLHKVSCPREILEEAQKLYNDAYESGYKEDNFGFWHWGDQIFIPAKDLSNLQILSTEKLSIDELKDAGEQRYRN